MQSLKQYWAKALQRIKQQLSPKEQDDTRVQSSNNKAYQAVLTELSTVQAEFQNIKSQGGAQLAELHQRIREIETERKAAYHQVESLKIQLADASTRQESTNSRLNELEQVLENKSRAALQQIEEMKQALVESSARQEGAEARVSSLARKLENERKKHQLAVQEVHERERRQDRRLGWSLLIAGIALLLGGIASTTRIWDARNTTGILAELNEDIMHIKNFIEQQPGKVASPTQGSKVEASANQEIPGLPGEAAHGCVAPDSDHPDTLCGQVPESDAVIADILHRPPVEYQNRADMLAFFEENALQPGVISMPSGLQYRVLRPGNGSSPAAGDTVVFDYRILSTDGMEFYSTFETSKPATVDLDETVPGLREALLRMEEGAQWELFMPPALVHMETNQRDKADFKPHIYVVDLLAVIEGGTHE